MNNDLDDLILVARHYMAVTRHATDRTTFDAMTEAEREDFAKQVAGALRTVQGLPSFWRALCAAAGSAPRTPRPTDPKTLGALARLARPVGRAIRTTWPRIGRVSPEGRGGRR